MCTDLDLTDTIQQHVVSTFVLLVIHDCAYLAIILRCYREVDDFHRFAFFELKQAPVDSRITGIRTIQIEIDCVPPP